MPIATDLKQPALPNYIELFDLDLTPIGGAVLRFTPNTVAGANAIIFGGNTYTPMPISGSGWETSIDGAAPQPTLKVSNVTKYVQGYLSTYKDLVGAKITRTQTFDKYLDTASFTRVNLQNYSEQLEHATWGWLNTTVSTTSHNLLLQSSNFSASPWVTENALALTPNYTTAPDGTLTATRAVFPIGTFPRVYQNVSGLANKVVTFSVWARTTSGTSQFDMYLREAGFGVVHAGGGSSTVTETWQRYSCTALIPIGSAGVMALLYKSGAGAPGWDLCFWGAQLEVGTMSNYIPTDATANVKSPIGSSIARRIISNTASGYHLAYGTNIAPVIGQLYTMSAYVKAGNTRYINFGEEGDNSWRTAILDTTTGLITCAYNCTNASATELSDGWFRVWISFLRTLGTGTVAPYVGPEIIPDRSNGPNYVGTGNETCYAWGIQCEAVNQLVQVAPNLIQYPEDFRQTVEAGTTRPWYQWTDPDIDIAPSTVVAPDGSYAQKVRATTAGGSARQISQTITTIDNGNYTISVYAKAGEASFIQVYLGTKVPTYPYVRFNLNTGAVTSNSGASAYGIIPVGNGWYRCWGTFNTLVGSASVGPFFAFVDANGNWFNASSVGHGLYIWGAQFESGTELTPYVPVQKTPSPYQYTTTTHRPYADPNQVFNTCVYVIEQKSKQNKHEIEFKLSSIIDQPNMKLPRQQVLRAEFPGAGLFKKS
jgi:phage-related protein